MNNFLVQIPYILCIGAIFGFVMLKDCSKQPPAGNTTIINNYYDSTSKEIIKYTPAAKTTVYYPVPSKVDTAAILQKYFDRNFYEDIREDSNIRVVIKDTIGENHLKYRKFTYQWLQPIKTEYIKEPAARFKVYAGINGGANSTRFTNFGPEVLAISKGNKAYGVGFNVIDRSLQAKALLPISFRKKK